MHIRRNIKFMLILFCTLFLILCAYLIYIVNAYGTRWFGSPYNTHADARKSGISAGKILDRTGEVLAYTDEAGERRYAASKATREALSHVVGDTYGQTLGAESMFSQYLYGFDLSLSERLKQYRNMKTLGSDVTLTVDAALSTYAAELMGEYWGALVLLNYKTGEILVSTSSPAFDQEELAAYLAGDISLPDSVMVNRATMGRYTPGSTFKIVTLLAALRNIEGVEDMTFSCTGPLAFDGGNGEYLPNVALHADYGETEEEPHYDTEAADVEDSVAAPETAGAYNVLRDYQNQYHGEITLKEAFASSCNTTFARLSMMVGAKNLQRTAESLCIGEDFLFSDLSLYASSYVGGDMDYNQAWSGVGQYRDLMTPLQMCMLSAAIANNGVAMEPKLLLGVATPSGAVAKTLETREYQRLMSETEAKILQEYMEAVVDGGTGRQAAVSGYTVCGKTGTAEISSDKSINTHAWFTGFVLDEEHPLAVCVILEQAGGGGSQAAPIAAKVFARAMELGY